MILCEFTVLLLKSCLWRLSSGGGDFSGYSGMTDCNCRSAIDKPENSASVLIFAFLYNSPVCGGGCDIGVGYLSGGGDGSGGGEISGNSGISNVDFMNAIGYSEEHASVLPIVLVHILQVGGDNGSGCGYGSGGIS